MKTKDADAVPLLDESSDERRRRKLPPLLAVLSEERAPRVHYLGVSFGLTLPLLKFWKRAAALCAVYLRQCPNPVTGEYSVLMLAPVVHEGEDAETSSSSPRWPAAYWREFRHRVCTLLSFELRSLPVPLALSLLQAPPKARQLLQDLKNARRLTRAELAAILTDADLRRLAEFAKNRVDLGLVMDLLPAVATLYFEDRLPEDVQLNAAQAAALIGVALQRRTLSETAAQIDVPVAQLQALLAKAIRKTSTALDAICAGAVRMELDEAEASVVTGDKGIALTASGIVSLKRPATAAQGKDDKKMEVPEERDPNAKRSRKKLGFKDRLG